MNKRKKNIFIWNTSFPPPPWRALSNISFGLIYESCCNTLLALAERGRPDFGVVGAVGTQVREHTSFLVFVMKNKSQHWSFQSRNSKSHNKICLAVSNLCSKNLLWTNQIYTLSFPKKQLVRSQASKVHQNPVDMHTSIMCINHSTKY
jgi:hypothetical protein